MAGMLDCFAAAAQLGGAIGRRPPDATAFPHRDAAYNFTAFAMWDDPADDEANRRWTREFGDAMQPYATGGVYVNEMADEGETRIRAAYGAQTYDRLAGLKAKHDPANLFRLNQNIEPLQPGAPDSR